MQQLKSALHTAEKKAVDAAKQLEQQQKQSEAEHRELADLREIMFNRDELENDIADEPVDSKVYPYTVQKSTVVFGGHETWVKVLKPLLKGDIKFIAKEMKIDVSLVRYADAIWIQCNAIPAQVVLQHCQHGSKTRKAYPILHKRQCCKMCEADR